MDDLYRENILDHYRYPRHKGHLDAPDIHYHDVNPFCGDEITMEVQLEGDRISAVAFDGKGCAISQASASMLSEAILGMTLDEVKALDKEFILEMLGIPIGPVRLKCALLALKTLKAGAWGVEEWPE
ncbi:MAG: SUF system NifU family Fe-S cluster assembly protein [Caldilineales bacterium]|nr:SUF system NifU family Fe-S cluster assembly protein [Caldilineales bacterium]